MEYLYINTETGEHFYPVKIHNFSRHSPDSVRIMGSIKLNPADKNYPDKKVVPISSLFEVNPVKFSAEFIKTKTF